MSTRNTKAQSGTDWKHLDRMSDTDIDFSDIPELDEDFFANATLRMPRNKRQVSICLDADILDWFKHQRHDYQAHINAVLRMFMKVHQQTLTSHKGFKD